MLLLAVAAADAVAGHSPVFAAVVVACTAVAAVTAVALGAGYAVCADPWATVAAVHGVSAALLPAACAFALPVPVASAHQLVVASCAPASVQGNTAPSAAQPPSVRVVARTAARAWRKRLRSDSCLKPVLSGGIHVASALQPAVVPAESAAAPVPASALPHVVAVVAAEHAAATCLHTFAVERRSGLPPSSHVSLQPCQTQQGCILTWPAAAACLALNPSPYLGLTLSFELAAAAAHVKRVNKNRIKALGWCVSREFESKNREERA